MNELQLAHPTSPFLPPDKISLIREQLHSQKATEADISLFLHVCESRKLDPILKQIHAVFRFDKRFNKSVMSIQVGIDGFRSIAARTGEYAGSDEPVFEYEDNGKIVRASVTVYRIVKGTRCPFAASAYWEEYCPSPGPQRFMWEKMPHSQIAKCAETLALRKAFPADASGLYEPAEMEQAGFEAPHAHPVAVSTAAAAPTMTPLAPIEVTNVEVLSLKNGDGKRKTKFFKDLFEGSEDVSDAPDLGEQIVPAGKYKGMKLKEKVKQFWETYLSSIQMALKDSEFPAEKRAEAESLIRMITIYVSEHK